MFKKIALTALGFIILIALQFISNLILKQLNTNFPAPLLAMILLVFLLKYKIIPEILIKDISELLLKNMQLFFVPLLVGITVYLNIIEKNFWAIIGVVFISTLLTLIISALFVENVIKYTRRVKITALSTRKENE